MNCSSAEKLFEPFLDGALAAPVRAGLLTHVDACAECRGVLEELRVVDALLIEPRHIDLAPNFTFATMAEVRALPPPRAYRAPVRAYLVSYLAAAWLLTGVAMVFAPQTMQALGGAMLDLARGLADAVGGLGTVIAHLLGRGGNTLTAALGALLGFDVLLAAGIGAALKFVGPRRVERVRS